MLKEPDPIPLLPGEQEAGLSVQTLVYPERYELPKLGDGGQVRHERAVALLVDDENRFRRTLRGGRYLHEVFRDGCWVTAKEFESLADLHESPVYRNSSQSLTP